MKATKSTQKDKNDVNLEDFHEKTTMSLIASSKSQTVGTEEVALVVVVVVTALVTAAGLVVTGVVCIFMPYTYSSQFPCIYFNNTKFPSFFSTHLVEYLTVSESKVTHEHQERKKCLSVT